VIFWKGRAPDIAAEEWINSEPLSIRKLKGKAVLLDFWTYSCVNCLRTLPQLKRFHEKYASEGLVIIGVHTPEFAFEKDVNNVREAVKRLGITYPVANDPSRETWNRYGNRFWPRAALINPKAEIVFEHVGESGYDEIERAITKTLGLETKVPMEKKRTYDMSMSKETYAGYLRNLGLGSRRTCTKDGCEVYFDPGDHERGVIYVSGDWTQKAEYLEFNGGEGGISFRYFAREVNVVMGGDGVAGVFLNGKSIPKTKSGDDVKDRVVRVSHPDMYSIVKTKDFHGADLSIIPFKGLRVYAYTFG